MTDYQNITPPQRGGGKKRLDYLDAARALAMICVVYHHVMIFTLDLKFPIFSGDFVTVFMVPLFFFISGYVAYKPVETWTSGYTLKKIFNKAQLLLIPTVVFFTLFVFLTGRSWRFAGGYWFTYSLFEMFLIYYLTSYVCQKCCRRLYIGILIAVSAIVMAATVVTFGSQIFYYLQLYEMRLFLPYFILGLLAKRFRDRFLRMLDKDGIICTLIITIVATSIWVFKLDVIEINVHLYTLVYGILRVATVALLFNCFRKSENFWSGDSTTARLFRAIGKRTLDIYMIHYFFLWPAITPASDFLTDSPNEMMIIPACLMLTTVAIALSLLISKLLRSCDFIATWLCGK